MRELTVLNWNTKWMSKCDCRMDYLLEKVKGRSFVAILEEVKPGAIDGIRDLLKDIADVEYSLDYRIPGKYDRDNRRLGVAALVSKDISIEECNVIPRALFPDRTLYLRLRKDGVDFKVVGLHSITGCDYKKSKSVQYLTFAEFVDEFRPDFVCLDANEPDIDHYDLNKVQFFRSNGRHIGAKTFFETLHGIGMRDALLRFYDRSKYVEGEPLITTHKINTDGKPCRYDYIFINEAKFGYYTFSHDYDGALEAGSDHALLLVEANTEPFPDSEDAVVYEEAPDVDEHATPPVVGRGQPSTDDERSTERLSTFRFSKARIPIGAELFFAPAGMGATDISCLVVDDTHVEYDDETYSLSGLAAKLLDRNSVAGPKFFMYDGERLYLRRRRIEGLK